MAGANQSTFFLFILLSIIPRLMYHNHLRRQRDLFAQLVQLLRDNSREMALDMRLYNHIGTMSHSSSSSMSSGASAISGSTAPTSVSSTASVAAMRSTASSPSLRSREGVVVPVDRQDGVSSPTPGGNVKVVVRVRGFLPRGRFPKRKWPPCSDWN